MQDQSQDRSLISIVKDFGALDELLIESGGELNPTLELWLQINETNLAEKVDNYKLYSEHLDARVEYFKKIKEQCNNAQNTLKGMVERMKANLKFSMESMKVDELRGEKFRYKLSKPSQKVVVTNQNEVPAKFTKERTVVEIDMDAVEKAVEAGETIPGVEVVVSRRMTSYVNARGA